MDADGDDARDGGDEDGNGSPPTSDCSTPTSSSTSEDKSTSSSESEDLRAAKKKDCKSRKKGKKREQKKWKKATHGVKFKHSFVWNGKPDIDVFEHWTFKEDLWIDLTALSDELALKLLVNFMSGSAGKFFMQHVATYPKQWKVKDVYIALFD
jgi:hypothetical protein